jgi:hypothetical protein
VTAWDDRTAAVETVGEWRGVPGFADMIGAQFLHRTAIALRPPGHPAAHPLLLAAASGESTAAIVGGCLPRPLSEG